MSSKLSWYQTHTCFTRRHGPKRILKATGTSSPLPPQQLVIFKVTGNLIDWVIKYIPLLQYLLLRHITLLNCVCVYMYIHMYVCDICVRM